MKKHTCNTEELYGAAASLCMQVVEQAIWAAEHTSTVKRYTREEIEAYERSLKK